MVWVTYYHLSSTMSSSLPPPPPLFLLFLLTLHSFSALKLLPPLMADRSKPVDEEDDDYMGDLSAFLPPETSSSHQPSLKKNSNVKTHPQEPSNKKPKTLNWQERRKIDRERKQREEDEKTLTNITCAAIPQSNIGFKMLKQMGYNPGSALGKDGLGLAEPVGIEIRRSRAGIGREDPVKEKIKRDEFRAEKTKEEVEGLMAEFGCRQKLQWRSRRVFVNYEKAKTALAQLENREEAIVEPEKQKDEDDEDEEEEEEEEEVIITEEDLQEILMKLREEHLYCLFCGCQYESMEELLSNCPGTDEDDH